MLLNSRLRLVIRYLCVFSAVFLSSSLRAQVAFYGAPPPSDISSTATTDGAAYQEAGSQGASSDATTSSGSADSSRSINLGIFSQVPIRYTFAIREGYDDNLFTTDTDKKGSFYTNWAAGANYTFGSPRLQLATSLGGGITYYYTRPGDKVDFNGQFALNATYLATPRLILKVETSTAYLSQPDMTIAGGTNRQDGDYLYSNTHLAADYQWTEKFSTSTGYRFSVVYYMTQALNNTQGRIDQTIYQSAKWLLLPKTTIVGEYRASPTTYFQADLNTFNNFFLTGVDQVFNPRFNWKARVGLQVGFDQNNTDGNSVYVGPYGESTLTYSYGKSSSILWTMRYGTEASGLDDVTQRQTFRTGLNVNHYFTPRISTMLGFNYQANYYDQSGVIESFYESIFDVSLAINYQINRLAALQVGYQFIADIAPSSTGREYTRNVAFIGANFAF